MIVQDLIRQKLEAAFTTDRLDIVNDSGGHNVPAGAETHFTVTLVSDGFAGQARLERHRRVMAVLRPELDGPVHALAIHAHTPAEWAARGGVTAAPPACRGGGR